MSSNIIPCGSGTYLHYGLERSLTDILENTPKNVIPKNIIFNVNVDGVPLTESSKSQLWPILGKITDAPNFPVFLIGAYHGYEKPNSIDEYLNCFIEEYESLRVTGFIWNE